MTKNNILSFREETKKLVTEISNQLSIPNAFENLEKYFNLIEKENQKYNLTGFSGESLWEEGIYNSIFPLWFFLKDKVQIDSKFVLADIGSGVGFPSIPFSIITNISVVAIEPRRQRCSFLELVIKELNLNNIRVIFSKAENVKDIFPNFITARAVGKMNNLLKIASPFLKSNTPFIFLKGPMVDKEILEAKNIIEKLNLKLKILDIPSKSHKTTKLVIS